MRTSLERQVFHAIRKYELLRPGERVLVGLSGGIDSVCLLQTLCSLADVLQIEVGAAHFNHMLRGEEADRDEAFCRTLCDGRVPFYAGRAEIRRIAAERGKGLEETAREERYAFLEKTAQQHGYQKIAVAHHRDDNVETVLMMFLRGTGLAGLCGMRRKSGRLIRPLLDMSRAELENELEQRGWLAVEDATNQDVAFTRNRIRQQLVPYLTAQFNPSLPETLSCHTQYYSELRDYLEAEAQRAAKKMVQTEQGAVTASAAELRTLPAALRRAVLLQMLRRSGAHTELRHTDALMAFLEGKTGRRIAVGNGVTAMLDYGKLRLEKQVAETAAFCMPLACGAQAELPDGRMVATRLLTEDEAESVLQGRWDGDASTAYCDAALLLDKQLQICSRMQGDRFHPLGMAGEKKLKDFLIDLKIPRSQRDAIPLVKCGGEIVWVCGLRLSERFRLTEQTQKVMELRLIEEIKGKER